MKYSWQNKFYWPGTCPNNFLFTVFLFNITKFLVLCPDQIIDKKILSDSVENIFPHTIQKITDTKNISPRWRQSRGLPWIRPTSGQAPTTRDTSSASTRCSRGTTARSSRGTGFTGQVQSRNKRSCEIRSRETLLFRSSNAVQKPSPKRRSPPPDPAQVRHRPQRQLHPAGGVQSLPGQHQPGFNLFFANLIDLSNIII